MTTAKAKILLALVFIARGTSFLFSKTLMQDMTPLSILAVRFILAFLVLAVVFHKKLRACDKKSFTGGVILGALYTLCMVLEMYGLRLVDTGVAALIENMAIVLVPLYAAVLTRTLPKKKTMLCAALAVAGVGFLSLAQSSVRGGGVGILLTILAALTYGVCIMATESVSRDAEPVAIGIIQLGVMGVLSLLIALPVEGLHFPKTGQQWAMMLMLVLVCSCFGFAFQPVGQKYVPAETAAVFTAINPLAASVLGITVAGESISFSKGIGYVLILLALFLYNYHPRRP
ncbi:MAG: DMT family transporter [Blautia sp.]|nr:DMT family transporter [Blautia sp.]